ncbi:dihydrofolate reductase [Clostridium algifaecis]|uniref:Dihydrofolate reductase n=1 Tax=Clostridium algifaecis TaxID=1472040 RepID=A0ABS4KT65_9CLOT|nr:dihydrofolate reductase [Clostridium algifaecis]MBP2032049.1 dihydrofolate reductase [Clostridium algifaecis]
MLSIIVAIGENNIIGKNNNLIWHISDDLKRFKKITSGKTIVMGRKTFESLPGVLPNRKHIILSRDKNYTVKDENVHIVHDMNDILKYKDTKEEIFIIGGGQIYNEFLPYCKRLYLTKIHSNQEGDTYFPKFDINDYDIIEEKSLKDNDLEYSFITLEKRV